MDLDRLRRETEADHEATERVMPLMEPGLTREQYAAVLQRLYRVVHAWEHWALEHASADLREIVAGRSRAPLLVRDLEVFGLLPNCAPAPFPANQVPGLSADQAEYRASFLGAMYVMEGSTLGGQHIARHVEQVLHLQPGQGDAYFRGHAERTGAMWRAFKAVVAELPDSDAPHVIAAARSMFAVFQHAMTETVPDGDAPVALLGV